MDHQYRGRRGGFQRPPGRDISNDRNHRDRGDHYRGDRNGSRDFSGDRNGRRDFSGDRNGRRDFSGDRNGSRERGRHDEAAPSRGRPFKRPRENDSGPRGNFSKRGRGAGGRGRGRGRGGARKSERSEYEKLENTRGDVKEKQNTNNTLERIKLCSNHFEVDCRNTNVVKNYYVNFEPRIPDNDRRTATNLINTLKLGTFIFDGRSNLYTATSFDKKEFDMICVDPKTNREYRVIFKETKNQIFFTDASFLSILGLMVKNCNEYIGLISVGRNFFDPAQIVDIREHRLKILFGNKTSMRQHEEKILLNYAPTCKVIRDETAYDMLRDSLQESRADYRRIFEQKIVGTTVMATYNNKFYQIHGVNFNETPLTTFPMRNGSEISLKDYYKNQYNIDIADVRQPILVSKAKAKDRRGGSSSDIKLIPELCNATGLTDKMKLDRRLMTTLSERTRTVPNERIQRMLEFRRRLQENEKCEDQFKQNAISIKNKPFEFEGVRLRQSVILFGSKNPNEEVAVDFNTPENNECIDWTSQCQSNIMYEPKELTNWVVMFPQNMKTTCTEFLKTLVEIGRRLGMTIPEHSWKLEELRDDKRMTYTNMIQDYKRQDKRFILIFVPRIDAGLYKAIKTQSLVSDGSPISTQVVCNTTIQRTERQHSIATKLAIQINCKLGGIPWNVAFPGAFLEKSFIVIGVDVSKRSKMNSYGAFVAYMHKANEKRGQYFSFVQKLDMGNNICSMFDRNVQACLEKFYKLHHSLPARIFIYRDGVGEGQIPDVNRNEKMRVIDSISAFYERKNIPNPPGIAFIIVNKKINTRIFKVGSRGCSNPLAGTVVDDHITCPERYDFYLISQNVTQGTVSPTSFNIIHDTIKFPPANLQSLTYKFTHLYYNWSGTVRLPAVVQYAKKLALLASQYVGDMTVTDTDKQLFFL